MRPIPRNSWAFSGVLAPTRVEASALRHPAALRGPTPLLRLQSDERLIALIRKGNHAAFEALVGRYQARLLAFCRHMLGSREDAEDVLQEVFAAAFNAILGDERAINVRPWLYRIARNRSLNHLRRQQAIGVDSMDVHLSEGGETTADKVHKREEFRALIGDVQELPETQKTALLLREIDALSYEQIAEAMETTVPSVKSLLVRARVSLAEMAEARQLTCEEVREELGEVAEGLRRTSAPVRRHLRTCDRCGNFRKQLKQTNKALASLMPVAPLLLFKKVLLAHLGTTAGAGGAAAAGGAAGAGAGGAVGAGISTVASKAAAGLAAAAIVGVGAVEVKRAQRPVAHPPRAGARRARPARRPPPSPAPRRRPRRPPPPSCPAKRAVAADADDEADAEARRPRTSRRPPTPKDAPSRPPTPRTPRIPTRPTGAAEAAMPTGGTAAGRRHRRPPRPAARPARHRRHRAPPSEQPAGLPRRLAAAARRRSSSPSRSPQPEPEPQPSKPVTTTPPAGRRRRPRRPSRTPSRTWSMTPPTSPTASSRTSSPATGALAVRSPPWRSRSTTS